MYLIKFREEKYSDKHLPTFYADWTGTKEKEIRAFIDAMDGELASEKEAVEVFRNFPHVNKMPTYTAHRAFCFYVSNRLAKYEPRPDLSRWEVELIAYVLLQRWIDSEAHHD